VNEPAGDYIESPLHPDPLRKYKREGEWKGGVRPPSIIERDADIDWLFDKGRTLPAQKLIVCGFCGQSKVVRTAKGARQWLFEKPERGGHLCAGEGVPIDDWLAA
jgi:hypothetical protein